MLKVENILKYNFRTNILLVFVYLLVGCSSSSDNGSVVKTAPSGGTISTKQEQPIEVKPLEQTEKWNTYTNSRYGFTIKYPAEWVTGEESDNGDGKALYIGNPDIDIRVYASHYLDGISDPYHSKDKSMIMQKTKLDTGIDAVLVTGKSNSNILYDMAYVSKDEIEYHFYAKVSESFFEKNEPILLKVAKSLTP